MVAVQRRVLLPSLSLSHDHIPLTGGIVTATAIPFLFFLLSLTHIMIMIMRGIQRG